MRVGTYLVYICCEILWHIYCSKEETVVFVWRFRQASLIGCPRDRLSVRDHWIRFLDGKRKGDENYNKQFNTYRRYDGGAIDWDIKGGVRSRYKTAWEPKHADAILRFVPLLRYKILQCYPLYKGWVHCGIFSCDVIHWLPFRTVFFSL